MNIESTIIQSVTTDLIDTTDIPPLIVDEDNAYDDIYVGKEFDDETTFVLTSTPTPRPLAPPPDDYAENTVMRALYYYFGELYLQIEFYFHEHYFYILIGLLVFVLFVIIPGVCAQIYCDRLYRKYKRESITRKILEVEAQLQCELGTIQTEIDESALNRPERRHYSSSSSSESESDRRRNRKDRKNRKSGKKVRSKSRNRRKERQVSDEEKREELIEENPPALPEKKTKALEVKVEFNKGKSYDTHVREMKAGKSYDDHVRTELKIEAERARQEYQQYTDQPPTYSTKHKSNSAAIQTGSLLEDESIYSHEIGLPNYQAVQEHDSGDFQAMKNAGAQILLPKVVPQVPVLELRGDDARNIVKSADHRSAFWSAGIIHQFNGVRTPPIPKKEIKPQMTKEAKVQGAGPITYEEIEIMNPMYNSEENRNRPTDYNQALLSITQKNDDIIGAHRAQQAQISNLMPAPETSTGSPPASLEPIYRPPSPPAVPPKLSNKEKSPLKAMNEVPNMELGRIMHSDAPPTNNYEGEIVVSGGKSKKPRESLKNSSVHSSEKQPFHSPVGSSVLSNFESKQELNDSEYTSVMSDTITDDTTMLESEFSAISAITPINRTISNQSNISNKTDKTMIKMPTDEVATSSTKEDENNTVNL